MVVAKVARIALAACLLAGPARAVEESAGKVFPHDPRVVEANSLLEHDSDWPRALELYAQALADDPENVEARLWRARILAWQKNYDESLAEFRALGEMEGHPETIWVERAEVLSWAARYDEAEAAFRAILAEDPENARAAAGLARVYLWSGRESEADRAYARALEIEDDPEVRGERSKLRERLGRQGQSDSTYFADNDDFSMARVGAKGWMDLDLATRLLVGTNFQRAHRDRDDDPTAIGFGNPETDRSIDGLVGFERRLGSRLRGSLQGGGRWWDHARSRALARGSLEYTAGDSTSLSLDVDYGDVLERTYSLDALLDGLNATSARGSLWHGFSPSLEGYGFAEGSFLSDGNERVAGGLNGGWQPDPDFEFRLRPFVYALTYTEEEPLYYTPSIDLTGGLGFTGALPLHRALSVEYNLEIGGGYAVEDGVSGSGLTYLIQGGFAWRPAGWLVRLTGNYARSQRAIAYRSTGATLSIGRSF